MLKKVQQILKRELRKREFTKRNIVVQNSTFIDNHSSVGDNSYIGFNTFITKSNIGRYVSIANNVSIGMGEHLIDNVSTSSLFYENPYETLTSGEIEISDDVWIGVNAVILRGVKIGRGAVIGAGSVVTKDVPPYAVVVGVPGRILKYRFSENSISIIEQSEWWKYDINTARGLILGLDKKIEELNGDI